MKITNDLRNIIDRKIREKEAVERKAVTEERLLLINKLEEDFKNSDEYKAYIVAFEKAKKLYDKYVADYSPAIDDGRYSQYSPTAFVFRMSVNDVLRKYDDMRDSLILKLSYGKDLEECVKILAEFGISL